MPSLNWIGKAAVVNHHQDVPFRLLEPVQSLSCGDTETGNLIVQGDNLLALKALLPRYAGQVKCIYIDPPYNTGNEGWVYNDNVNSPEIRRWLGEVVGKEGETLDRHDRWLCMMYPRLMLLKQFLREDGAIFVSIDDNEVASLRLLMNEVFGSENFVATVIWQKKYAASNDHKTIAPMHDFVLLYQRTESWRRNLLPRGEEKDSQYKFEDDAGVFRSSDYTCAKTVEERPNLYYSVINPNTGEEIWPKRTRVWAYSQEEHQRHVTEGLIYWGKDGRGKVPAYKRYKHALRNDGIIPQTLWPHEFAGHTDGSRKELREVLHDVPSVSDFATPKPSLLIQRILQIASDKDSIILDSFAGSGTTAHAVLKQNAEDGGNRRFILVEMDEGIARDVTAERVKRVAQGYTNGKGQPV
ncbi:MAG TPA: site-specific DNA-methyltransferase, partial [Thermomonas sp.]